MLRRAFLLAALCLACSACGYQWQGFQEPVAASVLGEGDKTITMGVVEQSSLYPWMPAFLRSAARDEMSLRKLARWVDEGKADYVLDIRSPSLQTRAAFSDEEGVTLLTTSVATLELVVRDGKSGAPVWRSGIVTYSELYERASAEDSLRAALVQALYRAMDRMQHSF